MCFRLSMLVFSLMSKDSLHKHDKEAGFNPPSKPLETLNMNGLEK